MPQYLRQIGFGVRFVLCRNGEKYRRVLPAYGELCYAIPVIRERDGQRSTLHHSCHVKQIITIKQGES